jgi:hypothetical protein
MPKQGCGFLAEHLAAMISEGRVGRHLGRQVGRIGRPLGRRVGRRPGRRVGRHIFANEGIPIWVRISSCLERRWRAWSVLTQMNGTPKWVSR